MATTHDLQYSIRQILTHSRESSFNTRADRKDMLMKFASDVVSLGFKLRHVHGLKSKHITGVVALWKKQGIANGTMKNRLSALRFLTDKINKPNIVPSNTDLGIGKRNYTPQINRAIDNPDFSLITDQHIKISLELQRVFGLRREESIKIRPHQADETHHLVLQPSWCKGKRGRNINIRTEEQCYWLEQAKAHVRAGDSLIPQGKSYIQHREVYDKQVAKAGIKNPHGLRHAYAQRRYKELTGWEAPINGGPTAKELIPEQKEKDYAARMIISEELGHSRLQIVKNYCG